MPLYEYECRSCGKRCELLMRTSDTGPQCPSCGSTELHKLLSTFAAHGGSPKAPEACESCTTPGSCCAGGTCSHR